MSQDRSKKITPLMLVKAYSIGVFPMVQSRHSSEIYWVEPRTRGVIFPENFHIPRSLRRYIRKTDFVIKIDHDFIGVIDGCASVTEKRQDTWINYEIRSIYIEMHALQIAHSVEVYQDGKLSGGLYGLLIGGVFFGESMFSRRTNSSKVALSALALRLQKLDIKLLDCQFYTEHLSTFGCIEVNRTSYQELLNREIRKPSVSFVKDYEADELKSYVRESCVKSVINK